MTPATRRVQPPRISQPVLAAWACVLAVVVGGAIGFGIVAVTSAGAIAEPDRLSAVAPPEPLMP